MTQFVAWFEQFPLAPGAVLVIGGFVLLSILFARLTQRVVGNETLRQYNDLTGFIFAVVGVIYAVLLGFIAVGVWERFATAEARTYDEAGNIAIIYRDAEIFPRAAQIRGDVRVYVESIISKAWPAMQTGKIDHTTDPLAERLAADVNRLQPKTLGESNVQAQMVGAMGTALLDRDTRLSEDATGLNGIMWSVVIFGGFITIGFSYLFGFKQSTMQTAMVGTLALLIGLVIFLTMSLDFPYRGTIHVGPDAFERAVANFAGVDAADGHGTGVQR